MHACSSRTTGPEDGPPRRGSSEHRQEPTPHRVPRSRYGNSSYEVFGKRYHILPTAEGYVDRGIASWYGRKFHGRLTSSREPYDMFEFTAAHRTLPIPTFARVTNLKSGRSVTVRINDRGPFKKGRIIDLSYAAAERLGITEAGTGLVEVRVLDGKNLPAQPIATGKALIFLQAGAFSSHHNARAQRQRLVAEGLNNVNIEAAKHNGRRLHRVRIGPLKSIEQADRLIDTIIASGLDAPTVIIE